MSLLIGELTFDVEPERDDHVTLAVLASSLLSATPPAVILRMRNAAHRRDPASR